MSSPSPRPADPAAVHRAGTLVYTAAGLRTVFAWLLAGEVVFTLIDMLEPKVLPVLLKFHGASDKEIGRDRGFVQRDPAAHHHATAGLLLRPAAHEMGPTHPRAVLGDPLRHGFPRDLTVFLAITPYSPEIATWLTGTPGVGDWLRSLPVAPIILVFALFVLLYRTAQTMTNVCFFGLLRDVIPDSHMGRFLALFRVFGAAGTFIITYWLLGHVETHSKPIFIGVAALNLVGFSALCWFVREGTYPPVEEKVPETGPKSSFVRAVTIFVRESYRHPVYLWIYFIRICLYGALLGLSGFLIFFPQHELGMDLGAAARASSWSALLWVFIAYPIGRLVDSRGATFVLLWGLILITVAYAGTFFLVIGPVTYLVSSTLTGVAFWIVMMAQLKLTQEVFHPQRYSQLAGANTIVQSLIIAILISPGAGWLLAGLKGWPHTLTLPAVGDVVLGPYRIVNFMMAVLYGLALFGLAKVRQHVRTHGGPENYAAPL